MDETETITETFARPTRADTALSRIVLAAHECTPPFLRSLETLFASAEKPPAGVLDSPNPDDTQATPPESTPPDGKRPTNDPDRTQWRDRLRHGHWLIFGATALGAVIFLLVFYYPGRVLPGVQLAGRNVYGADQAQLAKVAREQAGHIRLDFADRDKHTTPSLKQAGIEIDQTATIKQALLAKRSSLDRFTFWQKHNVGLAFTIDQAKLNEYLQQQYPDKYHKPQDASISYNPDTHSYDMTPSESGRGIDTQALITKLQASMASPGTVRIAITSLPTSAVIDDKTAQKAQAEANKYLGSSVVLTQHGRTVFTFEPQEIEQLLDITNDSAHKKIVVQPNTDKVRRFIEEDVTKAVAQPPRDEISVISGGVRSVIQYGVSGRQLADNTELTGKVNKALKNHTALSEELSIIEKPFEARSVSGTTRWIDVNLSTQTTRLMLDDSVVATFRISSGKAATPTDVGEHAIRSKFPKQTMSGTINGESYYVPNIPWVSYFDADAEAFHGTYWHSNFGTPMSHGCINMTIADAKTLYDYAPIGTRVSVHY